MDFYHQTGKMALGSRLRRLSAKFTEDAKGIYALYGIPLVPKWFPVFYVLSQKEALSITGIAQIIGHPHPYVSQIIKEMSKKELVITQKSSKDARVNVAQLSAKGKEIAVKIEDQYRDVSEAVEALFSEMQYDLWRAIEEIEYLLLQKDFKSRVWERRKFRESENVEIIDYAPEFREHFRQLNYAWIEKYFTVEEADRQYLDYPEENILQPGGHIVMARYRGEIVGTCALVKKDHQTYELAKMAVAENARGKNIGRLLGEAVINKARELGAKKIFLESNTVLAPAINLYQKLGFRKVIGLPSPYARCNIQMELSL